MDFVAFKTKALTHPVPRQYYAGQRRHAVELPDNIIIYARSEMPERRNLHRGLAHHRHVLFFVLEGHGSVLIGSERFLVAPGQMIFIPPHREHLMLSDEKGICFLYVSFEMAESVLYEKFTNRPIEMVDGIEKYLDDLLDCHLGENSEDLFHATRAALDILQILNCLAECDAVSGRLRSAPPGTAVPDRPDQPLFVCEPRQNPRYRGIVPSFRLFDDSSAAALPQLHGDDRRRIFPGHPPRPRPDAAAPADRFDRKNRRKLRILIALRLFRRLPPAREVHAGRIPPQVSEEIIA